MRHICCLIQMLGRWCWGEQAAYDMMPPPPPRAPVPVCVWGGGVGTGKWHYTTRVSWEVLAWEDHSRLRGPGLRVELGAQQ